MTKTLIPTAVLALAALTACQGGDNDLVGAAVGEAAFGDIPVCPKVGDTLPDNFDGNCLADDVIHVGGIQTYDDGCTVIIFNDGLWAQPGGIVAAGWGDDDANVDNPCE